MIHIALLLAALAVTSEVTVTNESPIDTNMRLSAAVDKQIADNLAALHQLNQLLDSGTNSVTLVKGFSVPSEVISNAVTFGAKWTNRVTFIEKELSLVPLEGKCPECGGQNHHLRRVRLMDAYDEIFLPIITEGRTNNILLTTSATNSFKVTNIVFQFPSPIMPPTPVSHIQRP